jgi:hypothetical protein
MKTQLLTLAFLTLLLSCKPGKKVNPDPGKITIASYYFPNYHIRGVNQLPVSKQHILDNKSEWELVKEARPRFEGHQQPHVPAWGYTDEKDPEVMAVKIDAAADYGVDVFIFDWYNYNGQPFLNQCLDEGFLKAKNTDKIKFALMWANHDWKDLFPCNEGNLSELEVMYQGKVTSEAFEKIGDEIVRDYFTKSNYWLIDGKAYFSIYDIEKFIEGFGSMEATKTAMDHLNQKAIDAGLKGIHWNLVAWGNPILPGEKVPSDIPNLIKTLGFNSATSYVWIHHVKLPEVQNDYNSARDQYFIHWDKAKSEYGVPYFPNVSMGWDSSPRTNQSMGWDHNAGYPYTGILVNNSPANFKEALQKTKDKLLADPVGPRALTINCWNEWTEGSYLEPDTVNGMAYLEALRDVFKAR